jgi:peptidoglycan hydrolase-like protein with peptidoglycan-binding domain
MALLDKLVELENYIKDYLALHENKFDTSSHNEIAEKLRSFLPKINAATQTPNTDSSSTNIGASVGVGGNNDATDVRTVQALLKIKVDGDCGPKTKKAIKMFQRQNDIKPVSGLIEPNSRTWNKLAGISDNSGDNNSDTGTRDDNSSGSSISASVGVRGENEEADVKAVQTLLKVVVDGDCGPMTKKAIKDFQRQNDIKPVSGLVEPNSKTWNKLAGINDNSGGDHSDTGAGDDDSTGNSSSISASVGMRGENKEADVKAVQTLLEVVVDGDCGPKTKKAIKDFQRQNDIKPVSGLIEPNSETWNKLAGISDSNDNDTGDNNDNNTPISDHCIKKSVGDSGNNDNQDVRVIQTMLNNNGYELAVNGTVNDDVIRFIKDFQRRKQQNPTGLIEPDDNTFLLLDGQALTRDTSLPDITINTTLQKSVGQGGQNETADVALVQRLLRDDWGYDIPVDGDPQDSTIQAIRQFQHRYAGMLGSQDARVDPNGTTIKYLTGVLKPTEGYSEDGIIGGVETELEKQMADFTKAFSGVRVEVNPGEWVVVRPPYHINLGKRQRAASKARSNNPKVGRIANSLGFGGNVGKATIVQIEDFLNQCLAANLVPSNQKNSKGLNEFLAKYGISTDCSGLAIQAANFLLQDDLERNKRNQNSEDVKITNTYGIQTERGRKNIDNPTNLRAGDMMVNNKREGTSTYHVRIVVDVDVEVDHVAFTTVESGANTTLGDGAGHGVGQRRWKCPNKTNYDNLQILMGNDWKTAGRSDQAYTYVRMRQTIDVE